MKGEYQNKKVWVRGKEVLIGVDIHKESWQGPLILPFQNCTIFRSGDVDCHGNQQSYSEKRRCRLNDWNPTQLSQLLDQLPPPCEFGHLTP